MGIFKAIRSPPTGIVLGFPIRGNVQAPRIAMDALSKLIAPRCGASLWNSAVQAVERSARCSRFRAASEHAVESRGGLFSGEAVDDNVSTLGRVRDELFDVLF
jgi:hypothetical protein